MQFQTEAKNSSNVDNTVNNKNNNSSGGGSKANKIVENLCSELSVTFKENKHEPTRLKSSIKDVISNRRKELKIDSSPELSRTMERFIDEKCNLLTKRGISKGGTTHLARWMKGQFDKQACASEPIESDDDEEEDNSQLQEWSVDDVKRRTKELNLTQNQNQNQSQSSQKADETTTSEDEQNDKSASKSTTSDSQVSLVPKFLFSKKTCITFEQTKNS